MNPVSWLYVGGVAFLYFFAFRWMWLDRYRMHLFGLRDSLFDIAALGGVSFSHPAYRMLREHINDCIRFAHRFGAIELALCAVWFHFRKTAMPAAGQSWNDQWLATLHDLSPEVAKEMTVVRDMVAVHLLEHLLVSTPLVRILLLGLVVCGLSTRLTKRAIGMNGFSWLGKAMESGVSRLADLIPSPRLA
jgi:hypothetical protein